MASAASSLSDGSRVRRFGLLESRGRLALGVRRPAGGGRVALPAPDLPLDTADDRRSDLRAHRAQSGGGARCGKRRGALDLRPQELRGGPAQPGQLLHAWPRVSDRRRGGAPDPRHYRQAARLARSRDRPPRPRLRRRRDGRSVARPRSRGHLPAIDQPRPAGHRRQRHHRRRFAHLRLPAA